MKLLLSKVKSIDRSILRVLYNGLKFCLVLALFSTFILSLYHSIHNLDFFYLGISLLKSDLFFIAFFIICAIAIDKMRKDIK